MCNQLLPEIRQVQISSPNVQDNDNLINLNPNDECDTQSLLLVTGLIIICLVLIYYIFDHIKTVRKTQSDSMNSNKTRKIHHHLGTTSAQHLEQGETVEIIQGGGKEKYVVLSFL